MRIDDQLGDVLANRLEKNGRDSAKIQEKLATGKRINRASDDAAGLAVAKEFEKQIRTYRSATENVAAGMSTLAIADGGASSISDMLHRQQELAIQSANGTLGPVQRQALDTEFQSLSQEIDRVSKSSQWNGMGLLDGSSQLSDGTGEILTGDDASSAIGLPHTDLSLSSLSMGTAKVDSLAGAMQALSSINTALGRVNDARATQGGLSNRLEVARSNLGAQLVNTTKGLSSIEDLDFAQGLTEKVRTDLLRDTNSASLSQFNKISKSHLLALLQ